MAAFSGDTRWIVFLAAPLGAALVTYGALVLEISEYPVVYSTDLDGAMAHAAVLFLMFDWVDMEHFDLGVAWVMIDDSWLWLVVWAVIASINLAAQLRYIIDQELPTDRWTLARMTAAYITSALITG